MKRAFTILIGLSVAQFSASNAYAVDGTVIFNGNVLSTCLLTIGVPGTITANADYTELSSKNGGGSAGTALIVTTGPGFQLSTSAASSFTVAPTTGNDNVVLTSSYSSSGSTTLSDVVGSTASTLGLGTNNVTVDLTATKTSGSFETGLYAAPVTVTCE